MWPKGGEILVFVCEIGTNFQIMYSLVSLGVTDQEYRLPEFQFSFFTLTLVSLNRIEEQIALEISIAFTNNKPSVKRT